jgi:hypothetical protein
VLLEAFVEEAISNKVEDGGSQVTCRRRLEALIRFEAGSFGC